MDAVELEKRKQDRARKRYSFSFGALRRSSTQSFNQITPDPLRRSISISSPSLLDDQLRQDLPFQLTNSIYNNQVYAEKKNTSYALSQSLDQSLQQSSTRVTLDNGRELVVPTLVVKCCTFILTNELLEGIFRVNASLKKIKQMETAIALKLEMGHDFKFEDLVDPSTDIDEVNSYDVAMILKRYLNNLKDFAVDHHNYSKLVKNHESLNSEKDNITTSQSHHSVASTSNSQFSEHSDSTTSTNCSEADRSNIELVLSTDAKDLSLNLRSLKLNLLTYILSFLHKLTLSESVTSKTKMSSLNLSKIFQPSLFEFKVEKQSSTENLLDFYKVNELILWRWIDNFDYLDRCIMREKSSSISSEPLHETIPEPEEITIPEAEATKFTPIQLPKLDISALERKQRRRSLFNYRSFSSPVVGTTEAVRQPQEEIKQSRLKRLPTMIFGSSYSLKSKLQAPVEKSESEQSDFQPIVVPRKSDLIPRTLVIPESSLASVSRTARLRKRFTYGFDSFKSSKKEIVEEPTINMTSSNDIGLQKKPLYGQDLMFNQSPRNSPKLEQSEAFVN